MFADLWSSLGNLTSHGSKACLLPGQQHTYRCRDYVDYIRKQEDRGLGNLLLRVLEAEIGSFVAAGFSFAVVGTFILLAVKNVRQRRTGSAGQCKLNFGEILQPNKRSCLRESLTSNQAFGWQSFPMFKDITFAKVLKKDKHSTTYLCQHDVVGSTSSLKVFNKNTVNFRCVENEWQSLLAVEERPYLVQGYALEESPHNWFIVMDYVPGETFMELWCQGYKFLPYCNVQFYLAELASALNWLHRAGVILRHLSADNVLLDKDGHVRISDFGFAVPNVPYGEETEETFESRPTTAPEMIQRGRYDYKVDAWSLGIFLFEIIFGRSPFGRSTLQETERAIIHDQLNEQANEHDPPLPQELAHVLQGLLDKDPNRRLNDHTLRTTKFFEHINWKKVDAKALKPPPLQNLDEGTTYIERSTSFQN